MGKGRKDLFKHRIYKDNNNKRLQLNKKENQSKSKEA